MTNSFWHLTVHMWDQGFALEPDSAFFFHLYFWYLAKFILVAKTHHSSSVFQVLQNGDGSLYPKPHNIIGSAGWRRPYLARRMSDSSVATRIWGPGYSLCTNTGTFSSESVHLGYNAHRPHFRWQYEWRSAYCVSTRHCEGFESSRQSTSMVSCCTNPDYWTGDLRGYETWSSPVSV